MQARSGSLMLSVKATKSVTTAEHGSTHSLQTSICRGTICHQQKSYICQVGTRSSQSPRKNVPWTARGP